MANLSQSLNSWNVQSREGDRQESHRHTGGVAAHKAAVELGEQVSGRSGPSWPSGLGLLREEELKLRSEGRIRLGGYNGWVLARAGPLPKAHALSLLAPNPIFLRVGMSPPPRCGSGRVIFRSSPV